MRTVIEKYQRLAQIQEQYADEIKKLAKKQLEIDQKVLREFNLNSCWEYRNIMSYDFLKIESDGTVELWDLGRRGDSDSFLTSIHIDPLVVKGDLAGYEQFLRDTLKRKAEQVLEAKQKENLQRREHLSNEMRRINEELAKLGS